MSDMIGVTSQVVANENFNIIVTFKTEKKVLLKYLPSFDYLERGILSQ